MCRPDVPSTVCAAAWRDGFTGITLAGSTVAAASDIHRQMPTHMADIRRDWLTNQNTD